MQKLYTIYFLLISGVCATAQPTLTASTSNPVVGNSYLIHGWTPSGFSPGPAGANQTWNFASTVSNGTTTMTFVAPSSTPYGSSFPGSNLAYTSGGSYDYWDASASYLARVGVYASGVTMFYSDIEKMISYPLTYSGTFSDNFASTFVSGGYTFSRTGSVNANADGYGTVVLPGGTLTDVLRVHYQEIYQDDWSFGTINYSSDTYQWYKPGVHYPIFSYAEVTASGSTSYSGSYIDAVSVGVNNLENNLSVAVYPNPVTDNMHVQFMINNPASYTISLINSLGQSFTLAEEELSNTGLINQTFDLSNYANGVYFLQIKSGDSVTNRMITVKK